MTYENLDGHGQVIVSQPVPHKLDKSKAVPENFSVDVSGVLIIGILTAYLWAIIKRFG